MHIMFTLPRSPAAHHTRIDDRRDGCTCIGKQRTALRCRKPEKQCTRNHQEALLVLVNLSSSRIADAASQLPCTARNTNASLCISTANASR